MRSQQMTDRRRYRFDKLGEAFRRNRFLLCPFLTCLSFQTVMRLVDGKLVQTQNWEGKSTTIEREVQGGKLIVVSWTDCLIRC